MSKKKRSRRRKDKQYLQKYGDPNHKDYHHILFQRKHWQNGYAKLLREHRYMGKLIPQRTLHRGIHAKIHDIPTPNGAECKAAYLELERRKEEGLIDIENDTVEQRIDFLIEMWEEKCPATVAILKWQKEIVSKFYAKGG